MTPHTAMTFSFSGKLTDFTLMYGRIFLNKSQTPILKFQLKGGDVEVV